MLNMQGSVGLHQNRLQQIRPTLTVSRRPKINLQTRKHVLRCSATIRRRPVDLRTTSRGFCSSISMPSMQMILRLIRPCSNAMPTPTWARYSQEFFVFLRVLLQLNEFSHKADSLCVRIVVECRILCWSPWFFLSVIVTWALNSK